MTVAQLFLNLHNHRGQLDFSEWELGAIGSGASTFGRNTGRLEIAATQTLVRLRGLSETRLRGFSLYSPRLLV
ncbi:MAG: hypothetical protein V7L23_29820 [Nostoc sp.]|uniref:hypothetical protein n=1 Tax=Nostoc sp. TaxID=1180 RepID=UPI002FF110BE